MATGAKVHDIDSIRHFRAALIKFADNANVALADAEGEITRKMSWLESEQDSYWVGQIRRWTEAVAKAKDAVRQKKIFKDGLGRTQSAVDEEKQLKICQAKLLEAETKLANTRRYAKQLQREHLMYRGGVQRLATIISADMPNAVAMLDNVLARLEAYTAASPAMATSAAGPDSATGVGADGGDSMKRAAPEEGTLEASDEAKAEKPDANDRVEDEAKPQASE